jgi:hypothetical protein
MHRHKAALTPPALLPAVPIKAISRVEMLGWVLFVSGLLGFFIWALIECHP